MREYTDICEACGEESDTLDDCLICVDCYDLKADTLLDLYKEGDL
jgi:hypothetical protein